MRPHILDAASWSWLPAACSQPRHLQGRVVSVPGLGTPPLCPPSSPRLPVRSFQARLAPQNNVCVDAWRGLGPGHRPGQHCSSRDDEFYGCMADRMLYYVSVSSRVHRHDVQDGTTNRLAASTGSCSTRRTSTSANTPMTRGT